MNERLDAQPTMSAADVREQVAESLYRMDHPSMMGGLSTAAGWAQLRYRERADMLAAAGLLAAAEHDARAELADEIEQWARVLYSDQLVRGGDFNDQVRARIEADALSRLARELRGQNQGR